MFSVTKSQNCKKGCQRTPCEERNEIDFSVSTAMKMATGSAKFFTKRLNKIHPGKSFTEDQVIDDIAINVFFPRISRLVTESYEKIPVFDLISDVGGQLGKIIRNRAKPRIIIKGKNVMKHAQFSTYSNIYISTEQQMVNLGVYRNNMS